MTLSPATRLMLVALLSNVILSGTSLAVSITVNNRSDLKWCSLISTLDEGYNAPVAADQPALTERGRRIASDIAALRRSLGCPS